MSRRINLVDNPIVFYSKSANLANSGDPERKEATRLINIRPYIKPTLFWIGNVEDEILVFGEQLGFDNRMYTKNDLSILLYAKCVIIRNHEISAIVIGFVKNYGIPLVWFSEEDVPDQWQRSFNLIVKYKSFQKFYGELWKIIA